MVELIILARRRGAKRTEPRDVIAGPSLDFPAIKSKFTALCLEKANPEFEEIEIGTFTGERCQRLAAPEGQKPQPSKKKKNENPV